MSLHIDRESLHELILTHNYYANPRDQYKKTNMKIRLAIVFSIMLFFILLICSAILLVHTSPIERSDSTMTFSADQ